MKILSTKFYKILLYMKILSTKSYKILMCTRILSTQSYKILMYMRILSTESPCTETSTESSPKTSNSKHCFTTSILGGRCRKAMLGVC